MAVQVVEFVPSVAVNVMTCVSPWAAPKVLPAVGDCVMLTVQLSVVDTEPVKSGIVPWQVLAFILVF